MYLIAASVAEKLYAVLSMEKSITLQGMASSYGSADVFWGISKSLQHLREACCDVSSYISESGLGTVA